MDQPVYKDSLLAMADFERARDEASNFCGICWGPLDDCPGHKGYMEMFRPEPYSDEELAAYRADREVRLRGLERREKALDAAAVQLGFEGIHDLAEKVLPNFDDE